MLGYGNESFIDPATVKALYARTTGEAATTGINLTAAKAAHFLGDIKAALEHAKKAETENEAGAAILLNYIKASSANNFPFFSMLQKPIVVWRWAFFCVPKMQLSSYGHQMNLCPEWVFFEAHLPKWFANYAIKF